MKLDPTAFLADPELIDALESQATPLSCGEERVLFQQGEAPTGLYILTEGSVTLTMNSPLGNEVISMQAGPGSILGLPGLIGNEPYSLSATAEAGAKVSFVDRERFLGRMSSDMALSMKVLKILAAEVRSARIALRDR